LSKHIKNAVKVFVVTFLVVVTAGAVLPFIPAGAAYAAGVAGLSGLSTLLSGLLSKGLDASGANFNQGSKIANRGAQSPRQIIYGRCRVGGTITHIETAGTDNHKLRMIVVLAGHEIEELENILINDVDITSVAGSGSNSGFRVVTNTEYVNTENENDFGSGRLMRFVFKDGSQTAADSTITDNSVLGANDKFIDCAYVFIEMVFDSEKFGGGIPPLSFIVKGKKVYDPRLDSTVGGSGSQRFNDPTTHTFSQNPALHILDYVKDTTYGLKATQSEVNLSGSLGSFRVAANTCDVNNGVTTATNDGAVNNSTVVTIDNATSNLLIDVGQKVTGTGIPNNVRVVRRLVNTITLDTAITINDGITLTFGDDAYTSNGFVDFSAAGGSVIEGILSSMAGRMSYVNGQFVVFAGASVTPTLTINDENLLAPITVVTKPNSGENYNTVKAIYVDANNNFVATDSPVFTSTTHLNADTPTGESTANYRKELEIQLPFTDSTTVAQRIARLQLLHSRQDMTISMVCNINYMKLQPFDYVRVNNERLNFSNKVFEVLSVQLEIIESDEVPMVATRLNLKEIDASIYTFATSDYITPVDEGDMSNVETGSYSVPAPTSPAVELDIVNTGYDLKVTWQSAVDDNVQGTEILYGTSSGTYDSSILAGKGSLKEIINNVKPDTTYFICLRHFSSNNVFSVKTSELQIATGTVNAPATISDLSRVQDKPFHIGLTWTNPNNSDLREIRIHRATSSFTTGQATNSNLVRTIGAAPNVVQQASFGVEDGLTAGTTYYFRVVPVSYFNKVGIASNEVNGSFAKVAGTDIQTNTRIVAGTHPNVGVLDGSHASLRIYAGNLNTPTDAPFQVTQTGLLTAENATISGTVKTGQEISVGAGARTVNISGSTGSQTILTAGSATLTDAPFRVLADGTVELSKVNIFTTDGGQVFDSVSGFTGLGVTNIAQGLGTSTSDYTRIISSTDVQKITLTNSDTSSSQDHTIVVKARFNGVLKGYTSSGALSGAIAEIPNKIQMKLMQSTQNSQSSGTQTELAALGGSFTTGASRVTSITNASQQFLIQTFSESDNFFTTNEAFTVSGQGLINSSGLFEISSNNLTLTVPAGSSSKDFFFYIVIDGAVDSSNATATAVLARPRTINITGESFFVDSTTGAGSDSSVGDITAVIAGTNLNGGGTSGSVTLNLDTALTGLTDLDLTSGNKTIFDGVGANNLTIGASNTSVIVAGDLTVQGTTTTLNTATLNVEDKNITLNYSTGDSSGSANGAGITIQDAVNSTTDATILWDATNDEFDFSHGITLPDSQKLQFGADKDLQIFHDGATSNIKDAGTGILQLTTNGAAVQIYDSANTTAMARFNTGGQINLNYAGDLRISTIDNGVRLHAAGGNFNTTASQTVGIAAQIKNPSQTSNNNGDYKGAIGFTTGNTNNVRSAIAAKQTETSANRQGLAFLVHPDTSAGTLNEALLINHDSSATFAAGVDVTGNIVVSGTVDGRDIATDGTKLDGIESGATTDQTQSEINALGITATGLSGSPNITVGTISSGNVTAGNTFLNTNGSIELQRSGGAFIDFKESGVDFDSRIMGTSSLVFTTGGNASTATALTLDSSQNATFTGNITTSTGTITAHTITATNTLTLPTAIDLSTGNNRITFNGNTSTGLFFDEGEPEFILKGSSATPTYVEGLGIRNGTNNTDIIDASRNLSNIGTISSGQINATTTADGTAAIIATNTGGVGSIIQRWVGDSDSLDIRCIAAHDYQISNSQQTNGIDFYDGTGGLAFRYNNAIVAQISSTGGFDLVTGAYKINGTGVITDARALDNITGFSGTSTVTNGYDFNCTDSTANTSFTGMMLDHNASGSDTLDADRTHRALFIDQDSSATGGDTSNEHRLYGLQLNQDASGDSDLVYGINILSIAKHSSGQISAHKGINSTARANTSATVSTVVGVQGSGQAQGAGTVTSIYGGFFKGHVLSTNTADRTSAYGVYAEVENDSDTTLTNAYAIRSIIDRDLGTITNGYLLYGNYEGTQPTNAYGVYIATNVPNYFAGTISSGAITSTGTSTFGVITSASYKVGASTVIDNSRNLLNIGTISSGNIAITTTGSSQISLLDSDNGFAASTINVENGGRDLKLTTPQDTIFVQGSTESMRILDGGNIGIGNTSPSHKLQVNDNSAGNTTYAIVSDNNGASGTTVAGLGFANGGSLKSSITAAVFGNDFMTFNVGGSGTTERMRIDSSGRLGIGTSSPRAILDLKNSGDGTLNTTASNYQILLEAPQGTGDYGRNIGWAIGSGTVNASINAFDAGASNATGLAFSTGAESGMAERLRIDSSGNVGIGTSTIRQKLHQHVGDSGANYHLFTNTTTGTGTTDGFLVGIDGDENALLWNFENTVMKFTTNNTERLSIGATGLFDFKANNLTNIGTISSGTINAGNVQLTSSGSIEIIRNGDAFIDFKSSSSEDFDCRIQQISDGIQFITGGNGAIATALTLNSSQNATFAGTGSFSNLVNALAYQVSGTQVISSARNLENIGTVSCGNITMAQSGEATATFQTSNSSGADATVIIKGARTAGLNDISELKFDNVASTYTMAKITGGQEVTHSNKTGNLRFYTSTNSSSGLEVKAQINSAGVFACANDVAAFSSLSDIRLKENIELINNPLDKIKSLRGVNFSYKKDGRESTGLIAQELEKVLPNAVYTTQQIDDDEDIKAIRYGNVVGLLVEAIKEQQEQIEELKAKLDDCA
jgi:hypothetical protein